MVPPPPRHTKFQDFIYNISLCPRGRRGTPGSILEGGPQAAPRHPASSAILLAQTHRTTGTHCHRRCCCPPCSPGGWPGHPSVHGAPSPRPHPPSVVVRLLLLCLTKPLEEGCDRFKGHALALLLSRVLATLPAVEGILFHHILVIQRVKEHPKQVCKQAGREQLKGVLPTATPLHSEVPRLKQGACAAILIIVSDHPRVTRWVCNKMLFSCSKRGCTVMSHSKTLQTYPSFTSAASLMIYLIRKNYTQNWYSSN